MTLRDIAHSRTGDKGRTINISVIAYHQRDYPRLDRLVTAQRVQAHMSGLGLIDGPVDRYALPHLGALNFVMKRRAGDTVTRTLAMDAHGKTLSFALLGMEIPEE